MQTNSRMPEKKSNRRAARGAPKLRRIPASIRLGRQIVHDFSQRFTTARHE
jgi:hypothetical protein